MLSDALALDSSHLLKALDRAFKVEPHGVSVQHVRLWVLESRLETKDKGEDEPMSIKRYVLV